MDVLNRHLKSETGVECARVVERGKGSGPGGGDVLGELDSGFDMSGVMMSSVTAGGGGGMVVEKNRNGLVYRRDDRLVVAEVEVWIFGLGGL